MEKYINGRDFGAKGSLCKTNIKAGEGSNIITVDDIGDFEVGDEVVVTKCFTHIVDSVLHERRDTSPVNPRKWIHNQPVGDRIEFEGYDGSQGSWVVYFVDFDPETPGILRWTNTYGQTWTENVPVVKNGWTEIEKGVRIKVNDFKELEYGCTAVFVCDDKMVSVIEKIEGNKVYLSDVANKSVDGEMMHSDSRALQKAIDVAIKEKKSIYLPNGRYTLANSLYITEGTTFAFEGESGTETIIDKHFPHVGVENFNGSCFVIRNCKEVVLKNMFLIGCSGFSDECKMRTIGCRGGDSVWGFYYNKSNATFLSDNESVYVENCHARKMSAECFYASSNVYREIAEKPEEYRRSITYNRCSVEDCARNAFNNNDRAEFTSILNCRVIDVAGCAWEGSSRFVRINGCYFRNTGTVSCGNVRGRWDYLNTLGTGQIIITDNYFEDGCCYGIAMVKAGSSASQIIIKDNVFVNLNSNAIYMLGESGSFDTPPENIIISGNSIDMTAATSKSTERYGIKITTCFTTVSDNHIYVRGEKDQNLTGIIISEDITKLNIHDNTISGCDKGIVAIKAKGTVGEVSGEKSFYREAVRLGHGTAFPRLFRRLSDLYKGWHIVWEKDGSESEIEKFDWESTEFTLKEPRTICSGDTFRIYNPKALPWSIHHNLVDNCNAGIDIDDSFSGKRALLDNNLVSEMIAE